MIMYVGKGNLTHIGARGMSGKEVSTLIHATLPQNPELINLTKTL